MNIKLGQLRVSYLFKTDQGWLSVKDILVATVIGGAIIPLDGMVDGVGYIPLVFFLALTYGRIRQKKGKRIPVADALLWIAISNAQKKDGSTFSKLHGKIVERNLRENGCFVTTKPKRLRP